MKKVLCSLAVVTMAAIMVCCSGDSTNGSEDADSVMVEDQEPSGLTINAGDFTLVMPEDWIIEDMASTFLKIRKEMPENLPKQLWFFPYPKSTISAWQKLKLQLGFQEEVLVAPVYISKKMWLTLYKAPEGDNQGHYSYFFNMPDSGNMNVRVLNGYDTKDPEIRAILESIKFN